MSVGALDDGFELWLTIEESEDVVLSMSFQLVVPWLLVMLGAESESRCVANTSIKIEGGKRACLSVIGVATLEVNSSHPFFPGTIGQRLLADDKSRFVSGSPLRLLTFIRCVSSSSCCIEAA